MASFTDGRTKGRLLALLLFVFIAGFPPACPANALQAIALKC